MNTKGGIIEAHKQFTKDSKGMFKSYGYSSEDFRTREFLHPSERCRNEEIHVIERRLIKTNYGRVEVFTRKSRELNNLVLKNYIG